eukprot:1244887-Karenia_brevis.AAC.1
MNSYQQFSEALKETAEETLDRQEYKLKKQWITETTWNLINQRDIARSSPDPEVLKSLNRQIRKNARKDKRAF